MTTLPPHFGSASNPGRPGFRLRLGLPIAASAAVLVALGFLATASLSRAAPPTSESPDPRLARAQAIRAGAHARMQRLPGAELRLGAPTTTDEIEAFMLLSEDLLGQRFVAAGNGVWYSICARRGPCVAPAPGLARSAADHVARRLALELAVRTFLETDAPVVAVSLPTSRVVVVVLVRDELAREAELDSLASRLRRQPLHVAPSAGLRDLVDTLTRPRTYLYLGPETGPNGGPVWGGMPRWPRLPW
jgi:hypothetical protein